MSAKLTPIITTILFLWLICLCGSTLLFAQSTDVASTLSVQLNNRTLVLSKAMQPLTAYTQKASASRPQLIYLQFQDNQGLDEPAVTKKSIHKEAYVGNHTYLCIIEAPYSALEGQQLGVTAWAEVLPEDKMSPLLKNGQQPSGNRSFLVQLSAYSNDKLLNELVESTGATMPARQLWKSQHQISVQIPAAALNQWAASPIVLYIQPELQPRRLNVLAEGYTNAIKAHRPAAIGGYGLLGKGVTVGVGDDTDPHHVDFDDRVTSFNPSSETDHAVHTTGTVGGNGIVDQRYQGFAPEADLIADFFSQIIANTSVYYKDFDMIATNNSYALKIQDCNYAGVYDAYASFLDQQAFDLPHVLHCFAAGNDGRSDCSPFPKSYATVVGAYSTAKNVLTVGAMGPTQQIFTEFSSKGPVKDGRLKPEIMAMGYQLTSTGPDNGYKKNSGTSMATPNVTGAATLLYQRYRQLHNNQDPDNALIKLVLMNGADDIATPGPDYQTGFGLMNIGRSLTMLDSSRYFSDSLKTGQQQSYTFSIPPHTSVAKVMLYWNDPTASPIAVKDLVNDLDLTVEHSGKVYRPLILNASPSKVTAAATSGADHTNNVEQVVLSDPASGSYTIRIAGYDIPEGAQQYYVAYSFIPQGMAFQYPFGGEALAAGDSIYIYWEASESTEPFTLSLSTDNGDTWQPLAGNIPAGERAYYWHIPKDIHSSACVLKISRGSDKVINKPFMIAGRPEVSLYPNIIQCPGSVRFYWRPVTGADAYQVFKKSGAEMKVVATTQDTGFTLSGLSTDSLYWFAVAPVINNQAGIRSIARSYQPNQGDCSGITQHGDLQLTGIIAPTTGRKHTLSELSASSAFRVRIRNADNQPASSCNISWRLNNQPWQHQQFNQTLVAAAQTSLSLPALNLADTGSYHLQVAVTNLSTTDPVPENDTLRVLIRQLSNDTIDLAQPFADGFESFPAITEVGADIMGVAHSNHWDFKAEQPHGRIRSFVNSGITLSGNRSVSLDNDRNQKEEIYKSSQNYFTGTFNLSNYNAHTDEVRCTFDYLMSGVPKFDTGNQVWIRGGETQAWLPLYNYKIDTINLGAPFTSGSLSLSDVLAQGGQNFSAATQIRFCQRDTSQIASPYYGNGLTLDDFSLYTVQDDIQLLAVDSVFHFNCALSDQVPLHLTLYNSVHNTVYNIPVTYQIDSLPPVTEIIDSIPGKTSIQFRFQQTMDLSVAGTYTLSAWCAAPSDNYRLNDSILDYTIHNQPVIDSFPYLQDFETDDGHFYTDGMNSSWAYGVPNSPKIKHAASGHNVWKTNLTGSYNDYELSFLYSPCFDISGLQNPTLSFSMASDIENNPDENTIYDEAYVEYTRDGVHWQRLGTAGELSGYNWYNNPEANAWTKEGETWWHVATVPLPKIQGTIAFRFVLKSDPGASFEGLAIDDIHIYDLQNPIYTGDSLTPPPAQNIASGATAGYQDQGQWLAKVHNFGTSSLSNTTVQRFTHGDFVNLDQSQYFLPESFVVQSDEAVRDSVRLHLYILGDAMKQVRTAENCPSCAGVDEIYRMGISQYADEDKSKENSSLKDNKEGVWSFIPWQNIRYIPYDKGYEAVVTVKKFSELWFNSGGPDGNAALNEHLFDFQASHEGKRAASLTWSSLTDEHTSDYYLQRADSNTDFRTIAEITPARQQGHQYTFIDTPALVQPFALYRILYQNDNGRMYYSPVRRLDWSDEDGQYWVYPNPVRNGLLYLGWFKKTKDPIHWRFFDYTGKLIRTGQTSGNAFNDVQEIHLGHWGLSSGIYLLKVLGPDQAQTFKIVYQP